MNDRYLVYGLATLPVWVLLFVWDVSWNRDQHLPELEQYATNDAPSSVIEGADIRVFTANGSLEQHLTSHRVTGELQTNQLHMEHPELSLQESADSIWNVTSIEGIYSSNPGKLEMLNSVVLTQFRNQQPMVTITTDNLSFFPEEERVSSNLMVTITSPGHRITSDGFDLDITTGTLILRNNVRGQHDPI